MSVINNFDGTLMPYEKCLRYGAQALKDEELVAVLLRTGTKNHNCIEVARNLLLEFGNLGILGFRHINMEMLKKIEGIGQVKAIMLSCVGELASRICNSDRKFLVEYDSPEKVANYFIPQLKHLDKEHMILLCLDTKCRILRETLITVGTVNSTLVSPREILIEAVQNGAVNIILIHNHPSGDPNPSVEDIETTERIRKAAEIVGIDLLDHIIIGDNKYISLKEINCI